MSFDEGLAERLRDLFRDRSDVVERKMFGGLCFMVSGYMCCGIIKSNLMAHVGADNYKKSLAREHVSEMDFTGKPLKGMVYIAPEGIESDQDLAEWVAICKEYVRSLPSKTIQ